ncbi:PepSY-associated TM helix [Variibacter gotjawalensis]|uniref:PepSY-associated TM helix n=1 Tax=Variibacter gotjawalensis TaxID=1333996 RepID=A0A0S3Q0V0_9BRAD|nr:PepSY-associated TM helix domain-containing protein [Variibacter gotjawalensis]NIK47441.1 putative iron-regulated membrane protein [Variibacter gotjawalensis]RZS49336.1 putative iron-regulated membrane protein [Variibacter gotjawalensis]BAT61600.1 PepSY-associated TM helix [Variibacter gotjawalensis]
MQTKTIRRWSWVHKWTSLISMVFLLLLCITGLPLIFHHEIDHILQEEVEPANLPADTPRANLDVLVKNSMEGFPSQVVQFLIWDRHEPNVIGLSIGEKPDSDPTNNRFLRADAQTGKLLEEVKFRGTFTYIMFKLHVDLFAGLPGKLFLGFMGLLFVIAVISGIVIYGPSMRKLDFGTVRYGRSRFIRWLDLHNLLGVVTIVWALVVGGTGVINTWADLVIKIWQFGQLAEITAQYKDAPIPAQLTSINEAVKIATERLPDKTPSFVAYPGTTFSSKSHYIVFMKGNTPLTSRLVTPVLVNAADGKFSDTRELPWYVKTLLVSQPLHFGDYGGMPLKIIWAILDVLTIIVLITGIYLWFKRRRSSKVAQPAPALAPAE